MSATIKDVARRAGLSVSTVSRALNGSGYISEEAKGRIERAVADLGYRPNWIARSLKGKPSRLVGLIIPDISNLHYTAVARSVSEALRANNYELIFCVSNEDPKIDLHYLGILQEKRVDGIIYVHPAQGSNSLFLRGLASGGMPIVELNRQREKDLLDAVLADNQHGAHQMVEYLVGMGHRRIGFIIGEANVTTGRDRLTGYRRAMEEAGVPSDPDLVRIGTFTRAHGEQATRELMALADPPTVIFAGSNRILTGTLYALRQLGLRVPDDISVVGFNDAEWMSIWNPPITGVDTATDEMGHLAVDLLLRRIASSESAHKPVAYLLSTTLLERASCKRLP